MDVLVLGCGYTGSRVANLFLESGANVVAATRDPAKLQQLARRGAEVQDIGSFRATDGCLVLHSVPVWFDPPANAARVVYLSTTGVYGDTALVDETTPAAPQTPRELARVEAEHRIAQGAWSWIVLRPAAIYGPGRGVHVSMQRGEYRLVGDGTNFVSRIHVDDLAAHAAAAMQSELQGCWPVADEEPCTSREIVEFCSELLNYPIPPSIGLDEAQHTRRTNRRVDGSAIRELLRVELKYPSYRQGIPASL